MPFFLVGGTALGLGRGDDIYPLTDLPKVYVVLIRPGFGVSTVEAYRWYDEEARLPRKPVPVEPCRRRGRPGPRPAERSGAPVVRHHPTIARIRQMLMDAGAVTAAMSGSGSAVFGLFERADAARRTARDLARPGWLVVSTRTLSRYEYRRLGGTEPPDRLRGPRIGATGALLVASDA